MLSFHKVMVRFAFIPQGRRLFPGRQTSSRQAENIQAGRLSSRHADYFQAGNNIQAGRLLWGGQTISRQVYTSMHADNIQADKLLPCGQTIQATRLLPGRQIISRQAYYFQWLEYRQEAYLRRAEEYSQASKLLKLDRLPPFQAD
jgi:hypothetical protein